MSIRPIALFAWLTVTAALVAWGAFAMFARNIISQEREIKSRATDTEMVAARESAALRLHALVRDTKNAREELDGLAKSEVLEVADAIESVGKFARVKVKIGGATPESSAQQLDGIPSLRALDFRVEAEGAFAALMHAVLLFENLPALSSIQNLEFTRIESDGTAAKTKIPIWRLSVRIRVMTTADTPT
jgi:hypothetical protein